MKITPPPASVTGTPTSAAGGDTGGSFPSPTVTGIQGVPVADLSGASDGDVLTYVAANDDLELVPPTVPSSGLDSITDGTTTITPVTDITVPPHSLSGTTPNASLGYVTDTYGGQEVVNTVAATGSTETLPATANVHDLTLTANCTLTLPTLTTGRACAISIILRQDGIGSRTVTWPGSVSWVTGTAPTLKTAAAAVDVVTLFTLDGGTSWGGVAVGAGTTTPLTTKGDLYGFSTLGARVPVGANGTHLRADSTVSLGVVWSTLHWEPHVAYDGTVVLNGLGDPVMVEVA